MLLPTLLYLGADFLSTQMAVINCKDGTLTLKGSHIVGIEMDHKPVPGVLMVEAYEDVEIPGNTMLVVLGLINFL